MLRDAAQSGGSSGRAVGGSVLLKDLYSAHPEEALLQGRLEGFFVLFIDSLHPGEGTLGRSFVMITSDRT